MRGRNVGFIAALVALAAGTAVAQTAEQLQRLQSLSPEQRQQVLETLGQTSEITDTPTVATPGSPIVVRPVDRAKQLRLKDIPEDKLQPFGYDLFLGDPTTFAPATEIPVPQDYVLGPGDTVKVQLFGNENATYNLTISRDGRINFPKLGPVDASGQSYDDFRELIERRVANEMIGVRVNVSLGQLRSIRVFVVGDANHPGSYTVSSLSTITNALVVSGGIALSGSLRNIQLKRAGRTVRTLDLYDLLLRGDSSNDARLQPGDVIFIAPVGERVKVAGQVKRPAIYELKGEKTVKEALALAGGARASAAIAAAQLERFEAGTRKGLLQVDLGSETGPATRIQDGDILRLPTIPDRVDNRIDVAGHVRFPGKYQWQEGQTMAALLQAAQILPSNADDELYYPLALIERSAPETGLRSWRSVNLRAVMSGEQAEALQPNDTVLVFTRKDIEFLSSRNVRRILLAQAQTEEQRVRRLAYAEGAAPESARPEALDTGLLRVPTAGRGPRVTPDSNAPHDSRAAPAGRTMSAEEDPEEPADDEGECQPLVELAKILGSQRVDRFAGMVTPLETDVELEFQEPAGCPKVFREAPSALTFLLENAVAVVGEVRRPGLYPVNPTNSISEVVELAGGMTSDSDASNVELVSYAAAARESGSRYEAIDLAMAPTTGRPVLPGDLVRIKGRYVGQETGTVEVRGEFRLPGRYTIVKGEKLSELIARAGGFTSDAYPYGSVFTRESARRAEEQSFRRAADELQSALVTAVTSGAIRDSAGATEVIGQLVQQLRTEKAVGRVVIETDLERLRKDPGLDILLEPGDKLFVPKKPRTVSVIGQVLNPGSLSYQEGQDPEDYIKLAGGFSQASDDDRVFLVLPNGSARPVRDTFWGGLVSAEVPPGSALVVPRDATPVNALVVTERMTAILRDLALSAAALATITR